MYSQSINSFIVKNLYQAKQEKHMNKKKLWETKWSVSWFDCDESLTCRGLNLNSGHFDSFTFIFVSFGESCLLVSWCAGGRCGMTYNDEDRGRSRRPGAEDRGWSHRSGTQWSGDREVGWRCVRSAPCTWRWGAWVSLSRGIPHRLLTKSQCSHSLKPQVKWVKHNGLIHYISRWTRKNKTVWFPKLECLIFPVTIIF
jgi:hypothetical protein